MESNEDKLYIKISCSICLGKVRSCPYCDLEGKHFIEASDKKIRDWLITRPEEDKLFFRKALEEE